MKVYKKIILGFIVAIIILGMIAFYSPIQNIPQSQPAPESKENSSTLLDTTPASSTAPDSNFNSADKTPTSSVSEKSSFEDLSGFSDLRRENDLLEEMGDTSTTSTVEDIFNELE